MRYVTKDKDFWLALCSWDMIDCIVDGQRGMACFAKFSPDGFVFDFIPENDTITVALTVEALD